MQGSGASIPGPRLAREMEPLQALQKTCVRIALARRLEPRNWFDMGRQAFELDVLACPRCGGRMRILAAINPPDAIQKVLACLGLPTRAPPIAPAIPDRDEAALW